MISLSWDVGKYVNTFDRFLKAVRSYSVWVMTYRHIKLLVCFLDVGDPHRMTFSGPRFVHTNLDWVIISTTDPTVEDLERLIDVTDIGNADREVLYEDGLTSIYYVGTLDEVKEMVGR